MLNYILELPMKYITNQWVLKKIDISARLRANP